MSVFAAESPRSSSVVIVIAIAKVTSMEVVPIYIRVVLPDEILYSWVEEWAERIRGCPQIYCKEKYFGRSTETGLQDEEE